MPRINLNTYSKFFIKQSFTKAVKYIYQNESLIYSSKCFELIGKFKINTS